METFTGDVMTIESMCTDAEKAVSERINRSAGQHLRASREQHNTDTPSDADVYAMCMESDTAYHFAAWICKQAGIGFPPQQENKS